MVPFGAREQDFATVALQLCRLISTLLLAHFVLSSVDGQEADEKSFLDACDEQVRLCKYWWVVHLRRHPSSALFYYSRVSGMHARSQFGSLLTCLSLIRLAPACTICALVLRSLHLQTEVLHYESCLFLALLVLSAAREVQLLEHAMRQLLQALRASAVRQAWPQLLIHGLLHSEGTFWRRALFSELEACLWYYPLFALLSLLSDGNTGVLLCGLWELAEVENVQVVIKIYNQMRSRRSVELRWPRPLVIPLNFEERLTRPIPEEFMCPISLCIMRQPVCWNGHTYDWSSLEEMLQRQRRGRMRDPVQGVMVPLVIENQRYAFERGSVQPNLALRSLIEAFVAQETRGRGLRASSKRRTATPG